MSKEKRRVPKLRFPGFTEDWEQRKLTDIAKTFIGLVTTMTENYRDSGTLLIRNSDIKEGQFIFSEKPIHLDEEFAEKNKTRRLHIGDVVTVHTGDIGTSAVIKEKEAGAIGFATINTRTDKRILNPYFLSTYFNTDKHKCYANSVSTGDGRSNYNIKDFNKLVISIPTLDEQEKISALINNINTIITLHQRKLEHLNLKKKALLQKLFPKNGERYPELRFPGFTDAWEQRKLSDVADVRDGTHDSPKFYNDGFPLVTSKNLKDGSIDFSDCSFISEQDFNEINKRSKVDPGDILFGMIGTIGKPAIVEHTGFAIKNVALIKEGDIINNRFIYHLLSSKVFDDYIARENAGGTQKFIALNQIRNFIFSAPTLAEQNKIIELLDYISQTITLHQRKLEHLKLQKKALLQQLFV